MDYGKIWDELAKNFDELFAFTEWLPDSEDNSKITEDDIIDGAKQEYCKNLEDIKKSRTTARLITLTEQKAWDVLNIEKPNSTVVNIYSRFVSGMPITQKEKDYLLWFLRDEKSRKIAQNVFSKVNLLQWDENKWAVNYLLKNEDWYLDFTRFLESIIGDLKEYKLIIPEGEDLKELKNWNDLVPEARYFEYKINSKTQICAVSDWKIFILDIGFESVKLLDNWMIFCVEEYEKGRKIWYLCVFDNNDFSPIKRMPRAVDLESLNDSNFKDIFKVQNEDWKKSLLEVSEQEGHKLLWNIKELILNEDDFIVNDRFITAVNWEENEWKKINIYETYIKQPDWLKLIANSYSSHDFKIKDMWDNLVLISTDDWDSLYKFNEKESRLEAIDSALMNMDIINIDNLLSWKPTVMVKEIVNWGVLLFDKETWELDILINIIDWYTEINNDQIRSRIGNKYYIHYFKDWILYKLKNWYKYIYDSERNYIIEKWFLWSKQRIFAEFRIEEMKEYLEPVNENELPVNLK
ncbi:MAG: hypothetical protein ACD_49C00009G0031 [uncultured bacterium (gcode 4)]|uniref:Uncharacterized protein n=1 Tax=uncultured bacterium (gcode 4) TaxID=1234023 RepID=K2AYH6_9BACT|nr:MAG: hypothetical protein ACD_49C00009G0031 [uncultured bacterium (gcode 4)]